MSQTPFYVWALIVFGATNIITQSRIFSWLRRGAEAKLGTKFFGCPMCVGFWIGAGAHLAGLNVITPLPFYLHFLAAGAASSGLCWILHVCMVALGSRKLLSTD